MTVTTAQPDTRRCTGIHTEHLCYMVAQGFHLSDKQEYKALVKNGRYDCLRCGRTAARESNLCIPVPL